MAGDKFVLTALQAAFVQPLILETERAELRLEAARLQATAAVRGLLAGAGIDPAQWSGNIETDGEGLAVAIELADGALDFEVDEQFYDDAPEGIEEDV